MELMVEAVVGRISTLLFAGFSPLDEVGTALFVETSAPDEDVSTLREELVAAVVLRLSALLFPGFSPLDEDISTL